MSKSVIRVGLCTLAVTLGLAASVQAQEKKGTASAPSKMSGSSPGVRTYEQELTVTAKVEKVDAATREITLKGPLGNVETFVVSDEVKRLAEIHAGDEVQIKYYIGIAAELRPPTEDEKKDPLVVLEGGGRAPSGERPGAAVAKAVRVVATIEALDRTTQTVTLKGPRGRYLTVRVADPSMLMKPRLGDTVVVTAAEGLAVSVEKVK